jgi:short-subunit dehydrogenase
MSAGASVQGVAVVTGATSGIGAAYAARLASRGYDLLVTGRREHELRSMAARWRSDYGVRVDMMIAELANEAEREALATLVEKVSDLKFLVNNAGFGMRSRFVDAPFERINAMVDVHVLMTLRLCHAALPGMLARRSGTIVNVSSLAAFIPYPGNAGYAATKALINNFSETLHVELEGTGVSVQSLCPGMTRTDFHAKLGENPERVYVNRGFSRALTAEEVVEASLASLAIGQVVCVPGANNRLRSLLVGMLPRRAVYRIVAKIFGAGPKK